LEHKKIKLKFWPIESDSSRSFSQSVRLALLDVLAHDTSTPLTGELQGIKNTAIGLGNQKLHEKTRPLAPTPSRVSEGDTRSKTTCQNK
jgi:hypothetical protein